MRKGLIVLFACLATAAASAQSLAPSRAPAPSGGPGFVGAPNATPDLNPGSTGLVDFVDIRTGLGDADLRSSIPSESERSQRQEDLRGVSRETADGARGRSDGVFVPLPPRFDSTAPRPASTPFVSREIQPRVSLAPSSDRQADAQQAAPTSASKPANLEGDAAAMAVLFDRAHPQDASVPLSSMEPLRRVESPRSVSAYSQFGAAGAARLEAAGRGAAALSVAAQKALPSEAEFRDAVNGVGGAMSGIAMTPAGRVPSGTLVTGAGVREFGAGDVRPLSSAPQKDPASRSALLSIAGLVTLGIAPFLGGMIDMGRGNWKAVAVRNVRFSIRPGGSRTGGVRLSDGVYSRLAQDFGEPKPLTAPRLDEAANAAAVAEAEARRFRLAAAGAVVAASLFTVLLAALLYFLLRALALV